MPGESVGVEIGFPGSSHRLRTRARVRHHDKLRCGMEFVHLTPEQKGAIRLFTKDEKTETGKPEIPRNSPVKINRPAEPRHTGGTGGGAVRAGSTRARLKPPPRPRKRGWMFLLASVVILLAVLWWRWDSGWKDLEADLHLDESTVHAEVHVPAEEMEKLVTHRVDPEYPEAARSKDLHGVVVVDVVVGRDGSVLSLHSLDGPEVFIQPAIEALRWWRFEPYRLDGRPVVAETTVAVEFKP
jgi:TonB family protein